MLLRFGCENFRSISKYQEIIFTASVRKDDLDGLTLETSAIRENVLPIAALYGANGSGKTNLLKGIKFFNDFIILSAKSDLEGRNIPTFKLNNEYDDSEQTFDADFILNGIHYHYGFSILDDEVIEEWLYSFTYINRASKSLLFHRDEREDNIYQFGKSLKGQNKAIANITSKYSLFLSVAAKSNHEFLNTICQYFSTNYNFRFNLDIHEGKIGERIKRFNLESDISKFISKVDIGAKCLEVSEVEIDDQHIELRKKLSSALQNIVTSQDVNLKFGDDGETVEHVIEIIRQNNDSDNIKFRFSEESLGTKSLISLLVTIFRTLKVGGVLIVDELESSLHTLLSLKLVELFNCKETNPNNAQLIFSTHETQLLNFNGVRRDQIWLTERCPDGSSNLSALSDFKIPKTANLRNGYLTGKFGGIPFLGDFSVKNLFEVDTDG